MLGDLVASIQKPLLWVSSLQSAAPTSPVTWQIKADEGGQAEEGPSITITSRSSSQDTGILQQHSAAQPGMGRQLVMSLLMHSLAGLEESAGYPGGSLQVMLAAGPAVSSWVSAKIWEQPLPPNPPIPRFSAGLSSICRELWKASQHVFRQRRQRGKFVLGENISGTGDFWVNHIFHGACLDTLSIFRENGVLSCFVRHDT